MRGDDPGRAPPIPGELDDGERRRVEQLFGVDEAQVVRDHVISHILAAIAGVGTDEVVFFGGTALARTLLVDVRLSEDIDLIALGDRSAIGDRIEGSVSVRLERTLGAVTFRPRLGATRHPLPSVVDVAGSSIQIQLLSSVGYPAWPTEVVDIEQRYSDAPPARLRVLTPAAFVAAKFAAWSERGAARDLYDLWALARAGRVDADAARLFGRLGPFTGVHRIRFDLLPTDDEWHLALGHQTRVQVGPEEAARVVREALDRL